MRFNLAHILDEKKNKRGKKIGNYCKIKTL